MASLRIFANLLFKIAILWAVPYAGFMPRLISFSDPTAWTDPDQVPRAVVTYGFAVPSLDGIEKGAHRHVKGQLLLVQRGALSCEVESGLWVVPPRSAIWIPGNALHSIKASGTLEGYNAFIDPDVESALPKTSCTVSVTPLLRELLIRSADLPIFYQEDSDSSRMVAVLLDELAKAKVEDLHLPMPTDPRLQKIVDEMMASPADRGTLDTWAKRAGLSEWTLARLVSQQTGMSFGRWRQQLSIVLAVKWLAAGGSIQQVAADLGYESAPSFVTMFRKSLGTSPGRYMAERYSGPD